MIALRCIFHYLSLNWVKNHDLKHNEAYLVVILVLDIIIDAGYAIGLKLVLSSIKTLRRVLNDYIDHKAAFMHLAVVLLFMLTQLVYNIVAYSGVIHCLKTGNHEWQ